MTRETISSLPSAMESVKEITARLREGQPAVFLDFDGTLAHITADPTDTVIPPETREAVEHLSSVCPVAVVSGRDLEDVRGLVGIEGIHYAGSHGFDVVEAGGERHRKASEFTPDLRRAADELDRALDEIPGAFLERKAFALAVHYRMLRDPGRESDVERAVDRVVDQEPRLRKTGGKKIYEVRPDVEWDKGKAVAMMAGLIEAEALDASDPSGADPGHSEASGEGPGTGGASGGAGGPPHRVIPLYVGDDLTDEDAFEAIDGHGVGVVVRGEEDDRETAASYVLEDPSLVREFLEGLARELERS